MAYPKY